MRDGKRSAQQYDATHHPTMDWELFSPDDYFAVKQVTETWREGDGEFEVTFWRRPITTMTEAIANAGFVRPA